MHLQGYRPPSRSHATANLTPSPPDRGVTVLHEVTCRRLPRARPRFLGFSGHEGEELSHSSDGGPAILGPVEPVGEAPLNVESTAARRAV